MGKFSPQTTKEPEIFNLMPKGGTLPILIPCCPNCTKKGDAETGTLPHFQSLVCFSAFVKEGNDIQGRTLGMRCDSCTAYTYTPRALGDNRWIKKTHSEV